ncbi:cell division protein FtsQ/DivIB [Parapedobacter indicus]|uniref:Cell division protein FtsQ n=1 Tax=Parapedobacter indicus TaxID=1477437 RepID=A0A1I3RLH9_9SPHI|nr:cell division protein FtsQ [Parapedobacter indicus]PPL00084.1 cell division protein FtsQ [Parapedobacter indicus]SFJ46722.1 cell division protein FtsQ [Parapedobacter indicus]
MFRQLSYRFNWRNLLYAVIGLLVLAASVLLMSFIGTKSSEQGCAGVRVIVLGNESFIEQKDITSLLVEKYGQLEGRTLESIPIHEMESDLRQIPFVFSAIVTIDMDGLLTVRVKQREAVVRVINEKGVDFYIDMQGHKMPVSLKYVPHVPVVNGHINEPYNGSLDSIESQLVKDIFKTAQFISDDSVWNSQVVQLYVNKEQDIELVPRVGNQQIILGNADSLNRKFEKLKMFYTKIVPKTGIGAYKSVNLKFAGQIVCERSEKFKPGDFIIQDSIQQNRSNNTQ